MSHAKMPWGKYKEDLIADVPTSYIVWLLDNGKVDDFHLLRELAIEVMRRMAEAAEIPYTIDGGPRPDPGYAGDREAGTFRPPDDGPRPTPVHPTAKVNARVGLILGVIESGYRAMAAKLHPDKGGDAEQMKELNSVRDAMRKAVSKI